MTGLFKKLFKEKPIEIELKSYDDWNKEGCFVKKGSRAHSFKNKVAQFSKEQVEKKSGKIYIGRIACGLDNYLDSVAYKHHGMCPGDADWDNHDEYDYDTGY